MRGQQRRGDAEDPSDREIRSAREDRESLAEGDQCEGQQGCGADVKRAGPDQESGVERVDAYREDEAVEVGHRRSEKRTAEVQVNAVQARAARGRIRSELRHVLAPPIAAAMIRSSLSASPRSSARRPPSWTTTTRSQSAINSLTSVE